MVNLDHGISSEPIEPKEYNFKKKIITSLVVLGTYVAMASNSTFFFTLDRLIKEHSREEINIEVNSEDSVLRGFAKYSMFIPGKLGKNLAYYVFDKEDRN
ncbi:MAG: hypothetical protein PVJ67_01810 [Candidatus Pacearchaeota archaeon]|jgi:hypothetical protein